MNIQSNAITQDARKEAQIRFNIDPDYRENPYKAGSRNYHIYMNEINSLETKESIHISSFGIQ